MTEDCIVAIGNGSNFLLSCGMETISALYVVNMVAEYPVQG
jgi:hypothetical protein